MRRNDSFGDREAHAGAADLVALITTAIELVKDEALFEGVDTGTAIRNAKDHAVGIGLSRNGDGLLLGRVEVGVVDELNENVAGAFGIRQDGRDLGTDLQFDRTVAQ